jgi:hypothetical protein
MPVEHHAHLTALLRIRRARRSLTRREVREPLEQSGLQNLLAGAGCMSTTVGSVARGSSLPLRLRDANLDVPPFGV